MNEKPQHLTHSDHTSSSSSSPGAKCHPNRCEHAEVKETEEAPRVHSFMEGLSLRDLTTSCVASGKGKETLSSFQLSPSISLPHHSGMMSDHESELGGPAVTRLDHFTPDDLVASHRTWLSSEPERASESQDCKGD